ncbi:MAG: aldo/keto reductase [Pseudomonadota bacterium]
MTDDIQTANSTGPTTTRRALLTGAAVTTAAATLVPGRAEAQTTPGATIPSEDRRSLGDLEVSPIGMGVQNMHRTFHTLVPERADMIALIRAAFDEGVTFFDCAEFYGPFTCEEILGEAIADFRDQTQITTKFGFDVDPETGEFRGGLNSRPEHVRRAVEGSLARLGTDRVDLLYQHRVDPDVPIEEVAGVVGELMDEGKVLYWGLSEPGLNTLRLAHETRPLAAVQNEYSMLFRAVEDDVLPLCQELGIGFVPFAPLGYGFMTGAIDMQTQFVPADYRANTARMDPENREANMALVNLARDWAERKGATSGQIALAYLLAQDASVVPIPGTTQLPHMLENVGANDVSLSGDELTELTASLDAIEVRGERAPPPVEEWNGTEAPDA